jgi:hypothetical protein
MGVGDNDGNPGNGSGPATCPGRFSFDTGCAALVVIELQPDGYTNHAIKVGFGIYFL